MGALVWDAGVVWPSVLAAALSVDGADIGMGATGRLGYQVVVSDLVQLRTGARFVANYTAGRYVSDTCQSPCAGVDYNRWSTWISWELGVQFAFVDNLALSLDISPVGWAYDQDAPGYRAGRNEILTFPDSLAYARLVLSYRWAL